MGRQLYAEWTEFNTFLKRLDFCTSGFPDMVVREGSSGRGEWGRVTTRLFPDLKFGCSGTIVRVTAAVVNNARPQDPKIQIWRENKTQPGLYHKISSDIPLNRSNPGPPCNRNTYINGIFQCILNEDHRISIQPGDFLGLEIPPIDDDGLEIYFKAGGPTNLVFQRQLNSTVNLSTEPDFVTKDEPQISFLIVLGKEKIHLWINTVSLSCLPWILYYADDNTDLCPNNISTITPLPTVAVPGNTSTATTSDTPDREPSTVSSNTTAIAGSSIGGIIALLLLVAVVLLVVVLIRQRKRKQFVVASNGGTYSNPVYEGKSLSLFKMHGWDLIDHLN